MGGGDTSPFGARRPREPFAPSPTLPCEDRRLLSGREMGGGATGIEYRLHHTPKVPHYVRVPEPQDPIAQLVQPRGARLIISFLIWLSVAITVDFDTEHSLRAIEIGHEPLAYRMLAPEMHAATVRPQLCPKSLLSLCGRVARLAGVSKESWPQAQPRVVFGHSCIPPCAHSADFAEVTPPPYPPPKRGRDGRHSFDRKCGKRMTSRIVSLPVRSIVSRSTPIPKPPLGGMP